MKKTILNKIFIIFILFVLPLSASGSSNLQELPTINSSNKTVQKIRKDIKKSIFTIKSKRPLKELPVLDFYLYKIKPGDTFWSILARTSLNIDTLATVNKLDFPGELKERTHIIIPNMRGIVYTVKPEDNLNSLAKKFKVPEKYIAKANKLTKLSKKFIFIPCGNVNNQERSLFLGTGFALPLKDYRKTSSFGKRKDPFFDHVKFHKGIDLACPIGTPVMSTLGGKVEFSGYRRDYGKLVIIKHAHDYRSYYAHLSKLKVKKGQNIKRSQVIALSGNTGRSTGPHLHFEIRKRGKSLNPATLLRKR